MDKAIYIIAEAGVNHDGSLDKALALVDVAARAGADAVKFQTFSAEKLVIPTAAKANYQRQSGNEVESQYEMLRHLELSKNDHLEILAHCIDRNIQFLSSPFDLDSLEFLASECDVPQIKLGSGELTNGPLLLAAAQTGRPIILSTGMASLAEVELALGEIGRAHV